MAKKKSTYTELPSNEIIEIIAKNGEGEVWIQEMKIEDWRKFKGKKEWTYKAFQKGFSSYPDVKRK